MGWAARDSAPGTSNILQPTDWHLWHDLVSRVKHDIFNIYSDLCCGGGGDSTVVRDCSLALPTSPLVLAGPGAVAAAGENIWRTITHASAASASVRACLQWIKIGARTGRAGDDCCNTSWRLLAYWQRCQSKFTATLALLLFSAFQHLLFQLRCDGTGIHLDGSLKQRLPDPNPRISMSKENCHTTS